MTGNPRRITGTALTTRSNDAIIEEDGIAIQDSGDGILDLAGRPPTSVCGGRREDLTTASTPSLLQVLDGRVSGGSHRWIQRRDDPSFASFGDVAVGTNPPGSAYRITVGIGVLVAVAAVAGLANPDSIYPTAALREFALANDVVSLAIAVPLLFASIWLTGRGHTAARLAWPGVLLYMLYGAVAYIVALPVTWVYPIHLVVASASVYAVIGLAVRIDAATTKQKLAGKIPERWSAGVLIALGGFSLVRAVGVLAGGIADGSGLERTELAVLVADVLISPAWIVGGWLLWRRTPYGFGGALGLLLQACMLFVGLVAVLALQPWIAGTEFAFVDVLVVGAMGLICFIPFVAALRQAQRSDVEDPADSPAAS
jgi:hypothetical protein